MVTISKHEFTAWISRFSKSLRLKLLCLFMGIALILILVINLYPIALSKGLITDAKRDSLITRANLISASLSRSSSLSKEKIPLAIEALNATHTIRILVCDSNARVLYDNAMQDVLTDSYALLPEIRSALAGQDTFSSVYTARAFQSAAAVPIQSDNLTLGVVYLFDSDAEQGQLLEALRIRMRILSLFLTLLFFAVVWVFSARLSKRFDVLLDGMREMRGGAYGGTVELHGQDELTEIADEFNALSKRLKDTEALRQTFVSDASHELRTPLSAIRLLTDSILQSETIDLATTREFMVDIGEEIDRLTRIAEKLLTLTRLDGAKTIQLSPVNLSEVTDRAISTLYPVAAEAGISLDAELSNELWILADPDGTHQIVFNLVENAIKYNHPGGHVRVMLFARDGSVTLLVDDDGIGIPPEDYDRIFERFYRVDKARARSSGKSGSGLGLAIVAKNVATYNGSITVGPSVSGGTRFTVQFPEGGAPNA